MSAPKSYRAREQAAPVIERLVILEAIQDALVYMIQWSRFGPSCAQTVADNHVGAEGLIRILEIQDCGSCGGFDEEQPRPRNLFDRWEWLCNKYHYAKDFKNYSELKKFFK